jgi:TonB family protein
MRSGAAQNRRFTYAVAISIVVHVIVLYGGLPMLRESLQEPIAPPPLVTRLVELPPPATEPSPPPEEKKAPSPRREPRQAEAPKPSPQPSPEPKIDSAPPEPPQAAAQTPAAPVAAPATAAPPQPQVDTRAVEAATAAQYRLQLIEAARRNKPPYPSAARENNWTGDVVLEIVLRADGRAELGLRRSSGHAVLDKLALDTYQQALRVVPVPPALQGRQLRLEPLRVIYSLTEN